MLLRKLHGAHATNSQSATATEFRLPVAINRVLQLVLGIERSAIRVGFSLPVGGSLIMGLKTCGI